MKRILFALALLFPHAALADTVVLHSTKAITVTPTITTSAYVAGDSIGGELTFANATRPNSNGGLIADLLLVDDDNEAADMTIELFSAALTGTVTDADPFAPSIADLKNHICPTVVIDASADCTAYGTGTICHKVLNCFFQTATTDGSVYAVIIPTATPTYTAATDLTVKLTFSQD